MCGVAHRLVLEHVQGRHAGRPARRAATSAPGSICSARLVLRTDLLVQLSAASDPADDPSGGVPVHAPSIGAPEDRPINPFSDGQVEWRGGAWGQRDEWRGDPVISGRGRSA